MRFRIDRDFVSVMAGTAVVVLVCMVNRLWASGYVMVIADVILAAILYATVQIILKNSAVMSLISAVKKKLHRQKGD